MGYSELTQQIIYEYFISEGAKEDEGFSDDSTAINVEDDGLLDNAKSDQNSNSVKDFEPHHESFIRSNPVPPTSVGIKVEPFDSGYGVHDAMLNGYTDLFHEVDSLMNIKHEDHLNDTVFYLPMSCPGEMNPHMELENAIQVSEVFKSDFPGFVLSNQDIKPDPGLIESLPFSETDFLNEHSKETTCKPTASSDINTGNTCSKRPKSSTATPRRKSADSGLVVSPKCSASTDYLELAEDIVPAGRKTRIKSGKSDSQSEDSGIGEPHSVSSSVGNTSPSYSESEEAASPVAVCSADISAANSPDGTNVQEESNVKERNELITVTEKPQHESEVDETVEDDVEEIKLEVEEGQSVGISVSDSCCSSSGSRQEPADIDRFVICSDHTMECVLCTYTTDSYSAFKSHIICSHPCWRITKKLSKNRLLVERSIKNGVRIPSKKIGEKALPGDLDSTLTGGRKLNKKYIYRRQLFERNKRLFKCVLCLRLFVFEGSVVNHVTETHQEKVAYDFIHVSNDHGEHFGPIYRCSQNSCFYSADSEADLTKHHSERHMQVIYRCQLCGFTAETADSVRAHGLRMHKQHLACFVSAGPIAVTQGAVIKSEKPV